MSEIVVYISTRHTPYTHIQTLTHYSRTLYMITCKQQLNIASKTNAINSNIRWNGRYWCSSVVCMEKVTIHLRNLKHNSMWNMFKSNRWVWETTTTAAAAPMELVLDDRMRHSTIPLYVHSDVYGMCYSLRDAYIWKLMPNTLFPSPSIAFVFSSSFFYFGQKMCCKSDGEYLIWKSLCWLFLRELFAWSRPHNETKDIDYNIM